MAEVPEGPLARQDGQESTKAELHDSMKAGGPESSPLPSISGFLMKKSTSGEWQRRYFETHGSFLTYYKSQKMTKLLAALSLPQVGGIQLVGEVNDIKGTGAVFQLDLKDRQYVLRTATLAEAENWVNVLIQLRDSSKTKAATPQMGDPSADGGSVASLPYAPPGPRDPPPPGLRDSGGSGAFVKEPRAGFGLSSCCVIA